MESTETNGEGDMEKRPLNVVFLHPDLGIGGAERAVVDAALALKGVGHTVHFVTAHHSPSHCFEETKNGQLNVTVAGDFLPRSIFGHCFALCAYIRMLYAALYLILFSKIPFDLVFCDQISVVVPIVRYLSFRPVIFYCHFPDLLLTQRSNVLKSIYRAPIDWLEEKTTGMANKILVNSKFTSEVFQKTFKSLSNVKPKVVYPIPNFDGLSAYEDTALPENMVPPGTSSLFVSINRYEKKKNIALAVAAVRVLRSTLTPAEFRGVHLIIAGGYDERVEENRQYYQQLRSIVEQSNLSDHVTFLQSFTNKVKVALLEAAAALVYTPDREHFGIVPVEAMYLRCPVVAVNSGGPKETVSHRTTGYLCEPSAEAFAGAMLNFVRQPELTKRMGGEGRNRVLTKFSFSAFQSNLCQAVSDVMQGT